MTTQTKTRPRFRRRRAVGIVALFVLALLLVSYARALTAPGSATWQMRTVDWARGYGAGPIINQVENWYYTRNKPATGPPDPRSLPHVAAPASGNAVPAPLPLIPGAPKLPGEAVWTPGRRAADGTPILYSAYFRPSPAFQSVVAGVAWMRVGGVAGHLIAGTVQPGGSGWPGHAEVASGDVPNLVATFNSGFKMKDIRGGFYEAGRTAGRLVNGQACLVIDDQGNVTVGRWGRDVSMNAHVTAVRQNLELVVDGGRPDPALSVNAGGRWGSAKNQYQYTWRSGIGIDRSGDLVYVAGNKMTLKTLAVAMVGAGVQRGMQLDIHPGMASFAWWMPGGTPTKLLPTMPRPADRYLNPDQRDFVYLTVR